MEHHRAHTASPSTAAGASSFPLGGMSPNPINPAAAASGGGSRNASLRSGSGRQHNNNSTHHNNEQQFHRSQLEAEQQHQQQLRQHEAEEQEEQAHLQRQQQQQYARLASMWVVLRRLPWWYQAFSALVVVLVLAIVPQNSIVGVLLGALHMTFGMEALWPPVYREHLDNITLHERLMFAGYACLLALCALGIGKLFYSRSLTMDRQFMTRFVQADEAQSVNTHLAIIAVVLPALVEAAMAVRGNVEDVFVAMGYGSMKQQPAQNQAQQQSAAAVAHEQQQTGDGIFNLSAVPMMPARDARDLAADSSLVAALLGSAEQQSHWRIQAATMLWTFDFWKQVVVIPAVCTLLWRLIVDVPSQRCATQRWNLVTFCCWRTIIAFVVFPQRFFCWVGWASLAFYLSTLGVVNYCRASSTPAIAVAQSSFDPVTTTSATSSSTGMSSFSSPISPGQGGGLAASPIDTPSFAARQRNRQQGGKGESNRNSVASPTTTSSQQQQQPIILAFSEFSPAASARESVYLTIAATVRSAVIIPFLCVAVLTVLAGVHVVELLALWMIVFLVCVWVPAAVRSFTTDAMALMCVGAALVFLLWLDEVSPLSSSSERMHAMIAVSIALLSVMLSASAWIVLSLSLPWRRHWIFAALSRKRKVIGPIIVAVLAVSVSGMFVARNVDTLEDAVGWFESISFSSWRAGGAGVVGEESNNTATNLSSHNNNSNSNISSTTCNNTGASTNNAWTVNQAANTNLTASLKPILLGTDNIVRELLDSWPLIDGAPRRLLFWLLADSASASAATQSASSSSSQSQSKQQQPTVAKLLSLRWIVTLLGFTSFVAAVVCARWLMARTANDLVWKRRRRHEQKMLERERQRNEEQRREQEQLLDQRGNETADLLQQYNSGTTPQNQTSRRDISSTSPQPAADQQQIKSVTFRDRDGSVLQPGGSASSGGQQQENKPALGVAAASAATVPRRRLSDVVRDFVAFFFGADGILSNSLLCDGTIQVLATASVIDRMCRTASLVALLALSFGAADWVGRNTAASGPLRWLTEFFAFSFALGVSMDIVDPVARVLSRCMGGGGGALFYNSSNNNNSGAGVKGGGSGGRGGTGGLDRAGVGGIGGGPVSGVGMMLSSGSASPLTFSPLSGSSRFGSQSHHNNNAPYSAAAGGFIPNNNNAVAGGGGVLAHGISSIPFGALSPTVF